jgi:hypothetical protein
MQGLFDLPQAEKELNTKSLGLVCAVPDTSVAWTFGGSYVCFLRLP